MKYIVVEEQPKKKYKKPKMEFSKKLLLWLLLLFVGACIYGLWICDKHGLEPGTIIDRIGLCLAIGLPVYFTTSTVQKIDRNNRNGNIITDDIQIVEREREDER